MINRWFFSIPAVLILSFFIGRVSYAKERRVRNIVRALTLLVSGWTSVYFLYVDSYYGIADLFRSAGNELEIAAAVSSILLVIGLGIGALSFFLTNLGLNLSKWKVHSKEEEGFFEFFERLEKKKAQKIKMQRRLSGSHILSNGRYVVKGMTYMGITLEKKEAV